mmetsp:Transcript_18248/g.45343  ORF Transcript_18248/g.45343 Transcript_18248/m.45343 type:complete len:834 (+) Transcript_18248:232-2733(+)
MLNIGGVTMGSHAQKGFYGQNAGFSIVSSPPQQMQSFVPNACNRCGHVGCDLKIKPCGCLFHARCLQMNANHPLTSCPSCHGAVQSVYLMPMDFSEIDQARMAAASMAPSSKRGKKRKNATIARLNPSNSLGGNGTEDSGDGSDLRTGRWTTEETEYCDKLILAYEHGELPISEGVKLNDFLATMLKSKQSRLTKKMKNAKLSAKTYKPLSGYVLDDEDAKKFSALEVSFFESVQCDMERAEIRFHMQKEWREFFSSYCVSMGQKLDANAWLSSAEELDRRASQAKDAARMARRKVMMGYALTQDAMNPERGVFIEKSIMADGHRSDQVLSSGHSAMNTITTMANGSRGQVPKDPNKRRCIKEFSSPFVGRVIQYIEKHQLPFEHIDAWVPSFVSHNEEPNKIGEDPTNPEQKCRLCFAGYASTDTEVPTGGGRPTGLSSNVKFDLFSFGEYSSKFSFDVGCGLPGRVYSSGICSWEQGVENAPSHQFERCGGAAQWGVKTVLGVPIPSPNVGRIVMLLYSRNDRTRDPEMVRRVTEELTKLMPTPKWKLVVDVGSAPPKLDEKAADKRIPDMLRLLAENIPTHRNSPFSPYLPGFTALRLLLLKRNRTPEDNDLANTMLDSYSSYLSSGRNSSETAWMVARDFMLLTQTTTTQQSTSIPQQQSLQTIQQQLQQHRAPQGQQQPLHQQLGQIQNVTNVSLQQQQHNGAPLTQHIQQLHSNHYTQIDASHHSQVQIPHQNTMQHQQNPVTVAPFAMSAPVVHSAHGSSNNLLNLPATQGQQHGLSSLGHLAQNGQNGLSQNGIATLSHLAQQHQMTHPNGMPALPNDKNGVPGV